MPDEIELRLLSKRLEIAKIEHKLIIEDDPPYSGQAMAIGIKPMDRAILKPFLSNYGLVAQSDRAPGVMTREAPGLNPGERSNSCAVSSAVRAPGVMTQEVGGSTPSRHAMFGSGSGYRALLRRLMRPLRIYLRSIR